MMGWHLWRILARPFRIRQGVPLNTAATSAFHGILLECGVALGVSLSTCGVPLELNGVTLNTGASMRGTARIQRGTARIPWGSAKHRR